MTEHEDNQPGCRVSALRPGDQIQVGGITVTAVERCGKVVVHAPQGEKVKVVRNPEPVQESEP